MKRVILGALACVALCACDPPGGLASYPAPPAGSFTAATVRLATGGTSEPTPAAVVTRDFFRSYVMRPLLGRLFINDEWTQGSVRVVLMSEDLWRRRFAAAPEIIGTTVDIDGAPATVIGVLPSEFDVPSGTKLWLPGR